MIIATIMLALEFVFIVLLVLTGSSLSLPTLTLGANHTQRHQDESYYHEPDDIQAAAPGRTPLDSPTIAFEIKFQDSGRSIRRERLQDGAHFLFTSDFKQITLECNSSYPKKWTFSTNLQRDKNIINWSIDKTRYVTDGDPLGPGAEYIFVSHLDMRFNDAKDASLSYTFNCQHSNAKKTDNGRSLSAFISIEANRSDLMLRFELGEKKFPDIGRYGRNKDCALQLHIDRNRKVFGCTHVNSSSSTGIHPSVVNCNDNDECSSLVRNNTNCASAVVETCVLSPSACKSFADRWDSGIFLCEVGDPAQTAEYNSLAAVFYFSMVEPKKLYFPKEPVPVHEILELHLINASAEVYAEETLLFNCTGSASYFSQGFYWILEYADGNRLHLGTDPILPDLGSKAYSSVKAIDFSQQVNTKSTTKSMPVTVYCLGPKWSMPGWVNVSMQVTFTNSKRNPGSMSDSDSISNHPTALVAVVVTFLILLAIFIVLGVCYVKKRARKLQATAEAFGLLSPEEIHDFLHGDRDADRQSHHPMFYPYNTDYEIGRKQFQIESKVLGDGQFGQVVLGTLYGKGRGKPSTPVAIKTVKKCSEITHLKALLSELKIMCYVGQHENLVSLVGACTEAIDRREVYLLEEFCENGCLLSYLKEHRSAFVNYLTDCPAPGSAGGSTKNRASRRSWWQPKRQSTVNYQNAKVKRLSSRDLLRWAAEVAAGMEHLAGKNVIHGDLAARNVLLTGNRTAKVGDFGLSKQLFDYSVYVQKIECPLPLRWMALESLRDLEFSKESDVWSYGVTLFEIFSLGQMPYPAIEWDFESWTLIRDGYRMERPDWASEEVYAVMLDCWHIDPERRPRFGELNERFVGLGQELNSRG